MAAMLPLAVPAQETLTVNDGTATSSNVPMYVSYFDDFTRAHVVYPASELEDMTGAQISAITFYCNSNNMPYTTVSTVDIYMTEVETEGVSAFIDKSTATMLYQGTVSFEQTADGGEATITFDAPYTYNGGNLLFGCDNTTDAGFKFVYFLGETVNGASYSGYNSSSLASVTSGYQRNFLPKTTFTYTPGAPITCPKPTNLAYSNLTATSVDLSWTAGGSETEWTFLVNGEEVAGIAENPYTMTLIPETSYTVKVQANCAADDASFWSNTVSFTTPPSCMAPTAAAVTEGSITTTSAEISWTDNNVDAPANGWTILVNDEEVAAPTNPFTLTTLTPSTSYTIKVKANCAADDSSAWSNTVTFATECEIFNVTETTPYVESFDGTTFPPVCWTREHTAGTATSTWIRTTTATYIHTGAGAAQLQDQQTGNKNNLVTGQLNIPEADAYQVSFWVYRSSNYSSKLNEGVKVWVSATPDTVDATEIMYIHRVNTLAPAEETTGWFKYSAPIPTSGDLYVIFEGISEYGASTYIDDIAVEQVPSCYEPSALHLDTVTATTATLSWTDNNENTPESWTISYTAGGVESTLTTIENPATIEPLDPETTYVVKVKANCDASSSSAWSQPINVTTTPSCLAPTDLEYSNVQSTSVTLSWTARNEETQWILVVNGQENLVTENPITIDTLTAETDYTVLVRAFCSADDTSYNSNTVAFYTGICVPAPTSVDNSGITNVTFGQTEVVNNSTHPSSQPYYGNYIDQVGDAAASTVVTVDVTYATGYTYGTVIWVNWNNDMEFTDDEVVFAGTAPSTNPTTLSCSFIVPLNTPVGEYRMRIGGADSQFDASITNGMNYRPCLSTTYTIYEDYTLSVTAAPACLTPILNPVTDVTTTTATISWTDNNETTPQSWTININGVDTVVTENPFTFDNLTAATGYTVMVKANCSADDQSDWSDALAFTTDCEAITIDDQFSEDFSGYTATNYNELGVMPTCWDAIAAATYGPHVYTGSYGPNGSTDNALIFTSGSSSNYGSPNLAVLPEFTNDLQGYTLSFKAKLESSYAPGVLTYGYITGVDQTTFNAIDTVAASTTAQDFEYTLPSIPAGTRLAFCYSNSNIFYCCAIDDVVIFFSEETDSCATPTNVAVNDNVVTWTGDAANYNVQVTVAGEVVIDTTVATTTFTVEGLENNTHASVAVQAVCAEDDLSEWSEAVEFDYTNGINNYSLKANIYPNPTTGNVTIESDAINADITVFDAFGKLLMTSKVATERTELNFSEFAPGVYMVRIANDTAISTIKVVKK